MTNPPFYRSYDGVKYTSTAYPAVVGDFRLDNYEITVGRFRKFAAAYQQPAAGSGKNPNDPYDTGWDVTWNSGNLAATSGVLTDGLKCGTVYQTWTNAAGTAVAESLPITCLDWYEAEAFCIWDGGRLPTEAEWNYAAAGGTQQRMYPWGSAAPDCSYANFKNGDYCVSPPDGAVNRVGSESPKGDGLYGQADLAGNVWEWVQDRFASPYTDPCDSCVITTSVRVLRGGSLLDSASYLFSSFRYSSFPWVHFNHYGARCARTP